MKKVLAISLILTFCIPFSGAFASKHGQWNYVGQDTFKDESKRINSGGGDFKFCLVDGPGGYYRLNRDIRWAPDEYSPYKELLKGKCLVYRNIPKGKYYVEKRYKSEWAHVKFYD
ncbi:hypothetical protein MK805_09125 [Shimazuella sp. AN120528]|uniref:hypothetical protein n=1 Tax=Shimazuella soli TaxID=1892854 RepID=UPI001F0D6C08|nr:hypothetical protein [Shimazuella soli]MCH5585130.1 hypothetical protein [Shimazuella soli]